ncbi:MAG: hypothetical protein HY460_02540 [Parcubacteria group bacterium]|nr:hypothetical protein [Parcubacteria group bacterium]
MTSKRVFFWGVGIVIAGGIFFLWRLPGRLDQFAQCLRDRGATFYGTFWCPHCQNQKELFGRSVKLLPYVECSTPDGRSQTQTCTDKNITGYPTWEFFDRSRLTGEISLERLSERTGCALP